MRIKKIKQKVFLKSSPYEVYETLVDSQRISDVLKVPATVSRAITGVFSINDGLITGTNVDLIQERKILQSWRMKDWPEGYYSTVLLLLKEVSGGTQAILFHKGIPKEKYSEVKAVWDDCWAKMKVLGEKKEVI